ncbi:DUF4142 domain-containing protein [Nonomuraea sp. NPDC005983]|uniref:DUF4142 domain-containing protein n=1 Tax=Nonomuraea sp. NPDC005983 TaxID=3155595 RepID=UPI0033B99A6D
MSLRYSYPTLLLAALAVSTVAGCGGGSSTNALGLTPETQGQSTMTAPSEQDETWMKTIHQGNLAEIAAGKLAQDQGATEHIKALGELLVKDHTKFDASVRKAAEKLGVQLPNDPTDVQVEAAKTLKEESGKKFDQAWIDAMIKAHEGAIKDTTTEQQGGASSAVQELAKTAMPTLEKHLEKLKQAAGGQ